MLLLKVFRGFGLSALIPCFVLSACSTPQSPEEISRRANSFASDSDEGRVDNDAPADANLTSHATTASAPAAESQAASPSKMYPKHWWAPVPKEGAPAWEVLPQEAKSGEVILSKRNELGILSNFAATPFEYRGRKYASVEGFWQMMLFPENANDPRSQNPEIVWPATREQVSQMVAFDAKRAGEKGKENMRKLGIDWVSFEGKQFPYKSETKGEHYRLIREAMLAKLKQNPKVQEVLLATGDLKLLPDHKQEASAPPEWRYFEIWQEIRDQMVAKMKSGDQKK